MHELLKNEQEREFTAGLYLASKKDKKIFGSKKYLNCKSINEYENCYVNFLLKKCNTKKEIYDELGLVMNMQIIYSKNYLPIKRKEIFVKDVIQKTLAQASVKKKNIIYYFIKNNNLKLL